MQNKQEEPLRRGSVPSAPNLCSSVLISGHLFLGARPVPYDSEFRSGPSYDPHLRHLRHLRILLGVQRNLARASVTA
jgi:hypothetical protein